MTLEEAASSFLAWADHSEINVRPRIQLDTLVQALEVFRAYYSTAASLGDITPSNLRDFLSRWYIENSTNQKTPPLDLMDSLEAFFGWAYTQHDADRATKLLEVVNELRQSLPRAIEINEILTSALRRRGGAFSFPEFLTTFEEGGSSQYDIDVPGRVGALDGYFLILRVEGSLAEAEELISEERVSPIVFPVEVAALMDSGYILSLELLRKPEGWDIAGCGFTYPPGALPHQIS